MLVLSRHRDESIIIGTPEGEIIITIVDLRGDKCRVGIDAPNHFPVHRSEVWAAIKREEGVVRPGGSLRRYWADPEDGYGGGREGAP